MLSSAPPITGAAMIAEREEVSTDTRAARPVTHTTMRASEDTLAVWTTESKRENRATNACHPVG